MSRRLSSAGRAAVRWALLVAISLVAAPTSSAELTDDEIAARVATVKQVGALGQGHVGAQAAVADLRAIPAAKLPTMLVNFGEADAVAANWLRGVAQAVADRAEAAGDLPVDGLRAVVADTGVDPRGRSLAFEILERHDEQLANAMLLDFMTDPSPELRRRAMAFLLATANKAVAGGNADSAKKSYAGVLRDARDVDQVEAAAGELRKLGETVDLTKHFGFLTDWKVAGPFENAGGVGFDTAYPPEAALDLAATYDGKGGAKVAWQDASTDDEYGIVDLNEAVGKVKGAVVYATAEFDTPAAAPAQVRLGCINANKVWVNGKLVLSNEVYHASMLVDQYIGQVDLKAGTNVILVKVCQNEQTESWAQRWMFQLRVTDPTGAALADHSGR